MAFVALSFPRPCEASARDGKNYARRPASTALGLVFLVPAETPAQHRTKAQATRQWLLRMRRGPPTRPCRDNSVCICDRSRNDRVRCARAEQPSFYSSQCSSLCRDCFYDPPKLRVDCRGHSPFLGLFSRNPGRLLATNGDTDSCRAGHVITAFPSSASRQIPIFVMAEATGLNEVTDLEVTDLNGPGRGSVSAVDRPGAYSSALTCQSEALIKAWYSAGEIDRLEYRQLITKMFLSCCQSLLTTSHSKVPPELTVIVRISPGFGMTLSSTRLPNRTSLFAMVSGASFPSRRTRREGILRLISTVCAI
jgi:hypothetical protein